MRRKNRRVEAVRSPNVRAYSLEDDGKIPNNPVLPLLIYQGAFEFAGSDAAAICEAVFESNGWGNCWRNGIFPFHHYHSTAHEVLGICRGRARAQFGGEQGVTLDIGVGDVVVIPAGVGHKRVKASSDLLVVGAYPPGQGWDLCRGEASERPQVLGNIDRVTLPRSDPVYDDDGPLMNHWVKLRCEREGMAAGSVEETSPSESL